MPVLIDTNSGQAYGPGDILISGEIAYDFVNREKDKLKFPKLEMEKWEKLMGLLRKEKKYDKTDSSYSTS